MKTQFISMAIALLVLTAISGCSDGDNTTITIEAPTDESVDSGGGDIIGGDNNSGGDDGDGPSGVACPEGTSEVATDVCQLPEVVSADLTLVAGNTYLLNGRVTVGNGNGQLGDDGNLLDGTPVQSITLTIEPGVQIEAVSGTFANLIITRGSQIDAQGTADAPIVFSSTDDGFDGSGEWGGLILHGYAPHNECTAGGAICNIDSEGESGFAGGYDPEDSSGVLAYVIVVEGGFEFSPGNEINGISLIGVGAGTDMSHIAIGGNSDDGIEFYGGTVNVKHLLLVNNLDDSLDWDEGFQGNLQYVLVIQSSSGGGEAFEMDTQGTDLFLSKPTLANVTVIADKREGDDPFIFNFKAGSGGFFHNTVVTVAEGNATPLTTCVNVDGVDSEALVGTALVLNNWIQDCAAGDADQGTLSGANVSLDNGTIAALPAMLGDRYESMAAEATGLDALDWPGINGVFTESVADPDFLDSTTFIGAVDPDDSSDTWYDFVDGVIALP
ncbi:conserved hypothetical protein [Luminiphilus syltensis NOR5-1B]|uniref:Lipoprotein n=1 Tax=Luminiphilus syltensis NOR5-1B TaxID=565045 RepID=B8KXX4_9GAMM|nr:hypothetical protein [Luminiphilus syltensis]EED34149.1 conserved hypothetical protein [Luminiphilus syltensis NOR5-1B]